MLKKRGYSIFCTWLKVIRWTNSWAKKLLAKKWRDPLFGARPLKRAMQRYLLDELAMDIIEGKFVSGDSVIVEAEWEELIFAK